MMSDYYYEQLVSCIEKRDQRIAELEAQVEALTPKPTVVSEWGFLFLKPLKYEKMVI
jgi:hypothetical protein